MKAKLKFLLLACCSVLLPLNALHAQDSSSDVDSWRYAICMFPLASYVASCSGDGVVDASEVPDTADTGLSSPPAQPHTAGTAPVCTEDNFESFKTGAMRRLFDPAGGWIVNIDPPLNLAGQTVFKGVVANSSDALDCEVCETTIVLKSIPGQTKGIWQGAPFAQCIDVNQVGVSGIAKDTSYY